MLLDGLQFINMSVLEGDDSVAEVTPNLPSQGYRN